jgi:hypothetical protein
MRMAISCPKNLHEILCKMALPHISGGNVSNLLQKSLETH